MKTLTWLAMWSPVFLCLGVLAYYGLKIWIFDNFR